MHSIQDEVVRADGLTLSDVLPVWKQLGKQFVDLLRRVDPSQSDAPVPTMTWTVGETAAHMLNIARRGLGDRRRADTLEGLAELNDQCIAETTERDLPVLASLLETDLETAGAVLSAWTDDDATAKKFPLHVGVRADIPTALSYAMFDFIGHGFDIGRATGTEWAIAPRDAGITLHAILPALGPWIKEDARSGSRQSVNISFVPDVALGLSVGQGTWRVESIERSEASLHVDPVELFLGIAGRQEPLDAEVGRIAAWFAPI